MEENILVGEPIEGQISANLGEICFNILQIYQDHVLQIDAETKEKLTGLEMLNHAIHLAKWFNSQGLTNGDAVAICSGNNLEFTVYAVACCLVGITIAPINPDYTTGELQHVINLSKPKFVCCSQETIGTIFEILPKNGYIEKIILLGEKRINHPKVVYYKDIMKGVSMTAHESFKPIELEAEEVVFAVLTSSGTTGMPKGVMLTHNNVTFVMETAKYLIDDYTPGVPTEGAGIAVIPFFHSFGFLSNLLNVFRGMTVVVMKKFNFKQYLEIIQDYKITTMVVPPPIVVLLAKHPLTQKYDLSTVKEVRCGAAPLSKQLEAEVSKRFNLYVSQGYGMTETTLGVLVNRKRNKKIGSVGVIVPGMMVKVINEEGKALGPYEEGELCFKGPLIMKGYINNPEATAETIDKDDWLHTGDVGYYDKDGYFYIVDRLKELIKYKAFQVAPAELEAILITHEAIADAAVIGLPDEAAGELPLAFVVKKPGNHLPESEVEKFVASKVSQQKQLRGGVIFVDEIPKSSTGKILRRVLRERVKKLRSKL